MIAQTENAVPVVCEYRVRRNKGVLMIHQDHGNPEPVHFKQKRRIDLPYSDHSQNSIRIQHMDKMVYPGFRDDDHAKTAGLQLLRNPLKYFAPIQRILRLKTDIRHQYDDRLLPCKGSRLLRNGLVFHISIFLSKIT
ncbi:hypothetical protein D3C73_1390640 [compost metagenome]